MATYLALCQKLRQNCSDSGTGPSAVAGQSGELKRYVDWVADAWTAIQNDNEFWKWMRKSCYCDTVAADGAYAYTDFTDTVSLAAIARFSRWYTGRNQFKCYLSSGGVAGEYFLQWMEWEDFKFIYRKGTQTDGQPVHYSVDPTQAIVLGPIPSAVYRVSGDYQIGPQTLSADGDIPEMPTRFHDLIVYEAMAKYGGNRVAVEAMVRANAEGTPLRAALELDQLPRMRLGRALV
ncbi:MAG: hypothetical protein WC073_11360 [Sterolibacterium sp.]